MSSNPPQHEHETGEVCPHPSCRPSDDPDDLPRSTSAANPHRHGDDVELTCSACLYVRPRPDIEDPEETELLTVINGHMVCLRHAPCARGNHHDLIQSAVHLESRGEMTSLSAYQDWRYEQDRIAEESNHAD